MRTLVLIRHARVDVDATRPADQWRLSAEGARAATALGRHPAVEGVERVFTSPEPKAVATATALALGTPVPVAALRELDRSALGWLQSGDDYAATVTAILQRPQDAVRGCERAMDAQRRMVDAVAALVHTHPDQTAALVSHGIVLTLYLAWLMGRDTPDLALWRALRFPDLAVVAPLERRIILPFEAQRALPTPSAADDAPAPLGNQNAERG